MKEAFQLKDYLLYLLLVIDSRNYHSKSTILSLKCNTRTCFSVFQHDPLLEVPHTSSTRKRNNYSINPISMHHLKFCPPPLTCSYYSTSVLSWFCYLLSTRFLGCTCFFLGLGDVKLKVWDIICLTSLDQCVLNLLISILEY